ncbi:hypothetical protein AAHA92_02616 [Salvia divinorum]|uniref:Retrotransposon gag domain-containing protein n=1 Tax=Salvia divinorum TaxID=28513 RepID=A0ABD1IEF8_SALDI
MDFRSVFLDYFFPATRTNALKKEIQGATQEDDETLNQYWGRFKRMLDACPNNRMTEAEIYNNFYEGMTLECKDLVNSASGRDFSRLRVSEAKRILSRLIDAKKAYDSPRTTILRRGTVKAASEQTEDKMEARMVKLEKTILSALEQTNQPTPIEKCQAPLGQEEAFPYYGPPAEMEYPAQVYAAGSWNANGSWNPGINPEGTNQWGNRNQGGNSNWSSGNQPNWSGRNQQENPTDSYVPPHQRGFSGGGANQQAQGGQQGQGYNHYSNQQGNPHFNQGPGYSQHASGSNLSYPRQQQGPINDLVGDLLNTQQRLHSNMQANNEVVHKLQDAQKEQKAAMDMIAKQLSQIATSLSEIRGNEGRIPATVKTPGKENISQIILRSGKAYKGLTMQTENGESSSREGIDGQLIKETGQAGDNIEMRREDFGGPLPQMADPFFLNPDNEVASEEKKKKEKEKEEEMKEKIEKASPECSEYGMQQTKPFSYEAKQGKRRKIQ